MSKRILLVTLSLIALKYAAVRGADSSTVWQMNNGIIKVEAESYSPEDWTHGTEKAGYSGSGYLRWTGGSQLLGEGFQPASRIIGSIDSWIILKFHVNTKSTYRIDLKMQHELHDGDNDIWVRYPETDVGWHKVGSKDGDARNQWGFTGWTYGENPIELDTGIHSAYITGRSHGFYLDYIVIYDTDGEVRPEYGVGDYSVITEEDRTMVENAAASDTYNVTSIRYGKSMISLQGNEINPSGNVWMVNGRRMPVVNTRHAPLAVLKTRGAQNNTGAIVFTTLISRQTKDLDR